MTILADLGMGSAPKQPGLSGVNYSNSEPARDLAVADTKSELGRNLARSGQPAPGFVQKVVDMILML
jgi:hypothetical protein